MGDSWQENCRRVVLAALAKWGWQLVDGNALARSICHELAGRQSPDDEIVSATFRHYSPVLYAACTSKDQAQRDRGLGELRNYLWRHARYQVNDDDSAEEFAQQAYVKTWESLGRCREPEKFLNYAKLVLINVTRDYFRKAYRPETRSGETIWVKKEITESELSRAGSEYVPANLGTQANEPTEVNSQNEFDEKTRMELIAIVEGCVENQKHRTVLVELIKKRTSQQIAEMLAITLGNVYVCKNRALEALRKCDVFLQFLEKRLA